MNGKRPFQFRKATNEERSFLFSFNMRKMITKFEILARLIEEIRTNIILKIEIKNTKFGR